MTSATASAPAQVLCFGEALIDFFPAQPVAEGAAALPAFVAQVGGAPANVAINLARLEIPTAFFGCVGRDAFGDFLAAQLEAAGVQGSALARSDARTPIAFVTVAPDGERRFVFYRTRTAEHELDPAQVETHRELVSAAQVIQLGTSSLIEPSSLATTRALLAARSPSSALCVDVNVRLHLWADPDEARSAARFLVGQADVVKADAAEAREICGSDNPAVLALGAKLAVVTDGARGARWACGTRSGQVAAPQIKAVDTTGAGDAFVAGLVAGLLVAGWPARPVTEISDAAIDQCVAIGCIAGSRACTAFGATTVVTTRRDLAL